MTVVDVHCHVFGVREIPVEGVLRRRFARHPARGLIVRAFRAFIREYRRREGPPFTDEELADLARRDPDVGRLRAVELDTGLGGDTPTRQAQARDPLAEPSQRLVLARLGEWADLLTETQADITAALVRTYPDVDLFTPLAMDMWDRFGGPIERPVDQQIDELADVIVAQRGRVHPFVPFDPRDDDAANQDALDRIRDAVHRRGFLGVKLYPSHGFRPAGNRRAPGPDGTPLGPARGDHYDQALDQLFALCAADDIPITAHGASGGAVAHPAMADNAHPRHWDPVLARHPLRLNLAHLGGYWHVGQGGASWTLAIAERMRRHAGLYTDLSFQLIFGPGRKRMRRRHRDGLRELVADPAGLGSRLLYGSDWHMFAAARRSDRYDRRMREHLEDAVGDALTREVMGPNALRFLGLIDGASRERLARFYTAQGIPHPAWWPT